MKYKKDLKKFVQPHCELCGVETKELSEVILNKLSKWCCSKCTKGYIHTGYGRILDRSKKFPGGFYG